MSDTKNKFYLTTPIYYVNARPHIGHAYSTIAADVIARRHRLLGDDTWFLTGTDEHGQKVQRSAEKAGIPPQQFTDEVSATFQNLWKRMGITNDDYIRTTDERHKRGVRHLWKVLEERGAIYLSSYTGQYSVGEEMFIDGPPGTIGPDGKPTETVTEENYFFRLSDYQERLLNLIESGELHIQPESVRNEVLSFVRGNISAQTATQSSGAPSMPEPHPGMGGNVISSSASTAKLSAAGTPYVPGALKDLSISRTTFSWGIPVPGDEKHVIYVWLDALVNYMTAVGYGSDAPEDIAKFEKYWPADIHLVGKEITRFHCVYWPAFLMAAGLPVPKSVVANGWLLFEESKMSKSRGNIVRTETILDAFGALLPKPIESADISKFAGTSGGSTGLQPGESTPQQEGALAQVLSEEAWKHEQDLFASDVIRYFLLREIPFGQDGSFSFDAVVQRYNSDLVNGYGNLVSRVFSMIHKYLDGSVPNPETFDLIEVSRSRFSFHSYLIIQRRDEQEYTEQSEDFDTLAKLAYTDGLENFSSFLQTTARLIKLTDQFISEEAPWKARENETEETRQHRLAITLYSAIEDIRLITAILYPVIPFSTSKVWSLLGIEENIETYPLIDRWWGEGKFTSKLVPISPIFPRADKGIIQIMTDMESNGAASAPAPSKLIDEKTSHTPHIPEDPTHPGAPPRTSALTEQNPGTHVAASAAVTTERHGTPSHAEAPASGPFANAAAASSIPDTPQIAIDDFVKIDLRVAQIVVAERIPKADKLLRLEVDLGYEKRQILSGIAEWYAPEDLLGRRIVIIANLAPRKMRGLESHGMLLAASHGENGKPVLATFGEDIELGSRLR